MPTAPLEVSRKGHVPTGNDRPIFRVIVGGNADGHDLLLCPIEKPKLVEMVVEPSHRVLDGHVQVPERVPLSDLEPAPDERVCPAQDDEELVHQFRSCTAFWG